MKFNLKNRPKPKIIARYGDGTICYDKTFADFDKWFEGFEKELREILDSGIEHEHPWVARFIREILGES